MSPHLTRPVVALLLLATSIATAGAALPPLRESIRELTDVLNNPQVTRKIEAKFDALGTIDGIDTVAPQTYRVRSGSCSLEVKLIDMSSNPPMEGAWQYRIEVGDLACPTGIGR